MQHGDIAFYYDLWAVWLCLTALVASGWAMTSAKAIYGGSGSIITVSYMSFVCCCVCSVLFSSGAGNDCGNLLSILCGLLVYAAACVLPPITATVFRWCLVSATAVVLVGALDGSTRLFFSNQNYACGFLAIVIMPLIGWAGELSTRCPRAAGFVYWALAGASTIAIIGLRARTAFLGALVAAAVLLAPHIMKSWQALFSSCDSDTARQRRAMLVLLCLLGVGLAVGGYLLLRAKPMSCAGRVLIWSVTRGMATQSSFSGVGFSNLANTYNLFQAEHFAKGGGSIAQRMAADACRHAFNEPLEVAAELGVPGLVLLLLFVGLILNEVWKVRRNGVALEAGVVVRASGGGGSKIPRPRPASPPPFGKGDVGGCSHSTFRGTG